MPALEFVRGPTKAKSDTYNQNEHCIFIKDLHSGKRLYHVLLEMQDNAVIVQFIFLCY